MAEMLQTIERGSGPAVCSFTARAQGDRTDKWFAKNCAGIAKVLTDPKVVTVEGSGHAVALDAPARAAAIIRG